MTIFKQEANHTQTITALQHLMIKPRIYMSLHTDLPYKGAHTETIQTHDTRGRYGEIPENYTMATTLLPYNCYLQRGRLCPRLRFIDPTTYYIKLCEKGTEYWKYHGLVRGQCDCLLFDHCLGWFETVFILGKFVVIKIWTCKSANHF